MSVPAAYIGTFIIWTTTPLAIKWSNEGNHFLVGVSLRMLIGTVVCLLLVWLSRSALPWHKKAWQAYLVAGFSIYLVLGCVYWAAQYIPSGWISVLFGLTPILTGLIASLVLGEQNGTPLKISGMLMGVGGLAIIFGGGSGLGPQALLGILGTFLGVLIHCISAVLIKKIGTEVPTLSLTGIGVAIALLLFGLSWWALQVPLPTTIPARAAWSILYLGLAGSVIGFTLYFYVLKHAEATRVALITLLTPVSALLLGNRLNGEPLSWQIAIGTATILFGLALFQFGDGLWRKARGVGQET